LTAWFTTILPLDGVVYVASLGADFADHRDRADGVVRVDGESGDSELLFAPPADHRGPRDIVGLAAGTRCLFAACHNGYVYCLEPTGGLSWATHVAAPIVAAPLGVDTNRDGVTDVVVVTAAGNAVALSGRNGRTTWVTRLAPAPAPDGAPLGATLALGDVLEALGIEIVVSLPEGGVRVLSARDGRVRWKHELSAGVLSGTICTGSPVEGGPPAHVVDRAANVWSFVRSGRALTPALLENLMLQGANGAIAAPRTLGVGGETAPILVVCPTGDYADRYGSVCAMGADGVRWRVPLGGAIWGTPAIADLNGDGRSEIVVASIEPDAHELVQGVLAILSDSGHHLVRESLPAPVECSPIVSDLDGDSRLEILVADQSGHLHCFSTRGFGPVEWGLAAGDSHNTRNAAYAYEYGQLASGLQWDWQPED
jgi:outer membrane protein assembly factor BamB